jgi:hypothetical protein
MHAILHRNYAYKKDGLTLFPSFSPQLYQIEPANHPRLLIYIQPNRICQALFTCNIVFKNLVQRGAARSHLAGFTKASYLNNKALLEVNFTGS